MAKHVTGDQYFELDGQLTEIKRQLRQPSGYPFDLAALRRQLQNAIEGKFNEASAPVFANDKTKNSWTLIENTPLRITSAHDLELVPFLKNGETLINGEEMVRRARKLNANYGQEDAEWLLEHQNEIPVKFRGFYLPFTGTVWQDSNGHRHVPYLYWFGEHWFLYFLWLVDDWHSHGRLLRPRK